MLAPSERLEQLCDYTAMAQIRKDGRHFRPDRAVASATADAHSHKDTIEAKGGAFRSRGKWYALSFVCDGDARPHDGAEVPLHHRGGDSGNQMGVRRPVAVSAAAVERKKRP